MGTSTNEYVLGENCYLSYDIDVYYSGNILWVSGNETKEYDLQEQLKGKINYFNNKKQKAKTSARITEMIFFTENTSFKNLILAKYYHKKKIIATPGYILTHLCSIDNICVHKSGKIILNLF